MTPREKGHLAEFAALARSRGVPDGEIAADLRAEADRLDPPAAKRRAAAPVAAAPIEPQAEASQQQDEDQDHE